MDKVTYLSNILASKRIFFDSVLCFFVKLMSNSLLVFYFPSVKLLLLKTAEAASWVTLFLIFFFK